MTARGSRSVRESSSRAAGCRPEKPRMKYCWAAVWMAIWGWWTMGVGTGVASALRRHVLHLPRITRTDACTKCLFERGESLYAPGGEREIRSSGDCSDGQTSLRAIINRVPWFSENRGKPWSKCAREALFVPAGARFDGHQEIHDDLCGRRVDLRVVA